MIARDSPDDARPSLVSRRGFPKPQPQPPRRVLPEDLYDRVHSDEKIEPGEIFEEIVRRRREQRET